MQEWLSNHWLVSYVLILGCTIYIFNKVFRPQQKLPILKEILVYVTMALGSLVLLVLQIDKLPIIQCMGVAVVLMLIYRIRLLFDKRRDRKENKPAQ
ncbi:YlaH-like family protein [Paenibacillus sp. IB182496]|uniref:YlaH-like family protein n=1 Tax=Paenibacillus sabuli TaxID=2772509 RepID=A0A927BPN0_9BACL|nr:YlaH-like family protein [Paenibacillus sabuli]MBD2844422.1 YlaH-like family protein [Paenibacillus sabuli]